MEETKSMSHCSKCGKEIKEGANFCPFCGNPVNSSGQQKADEKKTDISGKTPKKGPRSWMIVCAIVVVVIAAVVGIGAMGGEDEQQEASSQTTNTQSDQNEASDEADMKKEMEENFPVIQMTTVPSEEELQDYEKVIAEAFKAGTRNDADAISQAICPSDFMSLEFGGSGTSSWDTIGDFMENLSVGWCYEFYSTFKDREETVDITLTFGDSEIMTDEQLEDAEELFKDYGVTDVNFEEGRNVKAVMSYDDSSEEGTFPVLKYNGQWYMHPSVIY